MLNKETRRRIARQYIEKNFGKYAFKVTRNGVEPDLNRPFELWAENDGISFEVIHAPYVSGNHKRAIAVSDSKEELNKSVLENFHKESVTTGCVEYDKFKDYYIAYD